MARGRMLDKSLSTSKCYVDLHEIAGPLAEFCQAIYPLLIAHSDDYGRHAGDAFTIKLVVCPGSPRSVGDVEAALDALARAGLIVRYLSKGKPALEIVDFKPHQPGLKQRGGTTFEPPPRSFVRDLADSAECRDLPSSAAECRDVSASAVDCPDVPPTGRKAPSRAGAELNRTEWNRREEKARPLGARSSTDHRDQSKSSGPGRARSRAAARRSSPNVKQLTAVVLRDVLPALNVTTIPKGDDWIDLVEASKRRAAREGMPYDSTSIDKAIHAALARHRKNGGPS